MSSCRRLLPAAIVLASLLLAPVAAAAPIVGPSFALPGVPAGIVGTADGGAWVALDGSGPDEDVVARIAPDGIVTGYHPPGVPGARGIALVGSELWLTSAGQVTRFTPGGAATEIPIAGLQPQTIVQGVDGRMWTASDAKLHAIDPAGSVTTYDVPGMSARGIAATTTGVVVADFAGSARSFTTAGVPGPFLTLGGGPQEVAVDAAGAIAATNPGADPQEVDVLRGGVLARLAVPVTDPGGITAGLDGAFWVAQFNTGISRIAPDGSVTPFPLAPGAGARRITAAGGGRLWASLETAKAVQLVTGLDAPVAPVPPPVTPGPVFTGPVQLPPRPKVPFTLRIRRASVTTTYAPERVVKLTVRVVTSRDARVEISLDRFFAGRRTPRGACVSPRKAPNGTTCPRWLGEQDRVQRNKANKVWTAIYRHLPAGRYRLKASARSGGAVRFQTLKRILVIRR